MRAEDVAAAVRTKHTSAPTPQRRHGDVLSGGGWEGQDALFLVELAVLVEVEKLHHIVLDLDVIDGHIPRLGQERGEDNSGTDCDGHTLCSRFGSLPPRSEA